MERIVDDDVRPRGVKTFSLSFSLFTRCDVQMRIDFDGGGEERAPADALQLGEDSAGDERYIHMRERVGEDRGKRAHISSSSSSNGPSFSGALSQMTLEKEKERINISSNMTFHSDRWASLFFLLSEYIYFIYNET